MRSATADAKATAC